MEGKARQGEKKRRQDRSSWMDRLRISGGQSSLQGGQNAHLPKNVLCILRLVGCLK